MILSRVSLFIFLISNTLWGQTTEKTYWIFFKDKPDYLHATVIPDISPRALERRLKQNPHTSALIDESDYPVSSDYLAALSSHLVLIHNTSRWLNAACVQINERNIPLIQSLPFIREIRPVRARSVIASTSSHASSFSSIAASFSRFSYGASLRQNAFVNAVAAHDSGYSGKGVRIGMIDTGFNLTHTAFSGIHVVADSDFVDHDGNVSEIGSKFTSSHGTFVLSAIASFHESFLIGTAFGADYILARTENNSDAIYELADESRWIAALEWMEQIGADIVSSSTSFFDEFPGTSNDYTIRDLDGKTGLTTLATDIAFKKGLLVFNSSGNNGAEDQDQYRVSTPSDGKHMIAVGATIGDSTVASFSSRGPTADGRKKPDVAALGYEIRVVSSGTTGYQNFSGTSLSTPIVAGIAALALEANPAWSGSELYDAVRKTASLSKKPNHTIGYGVPDAMKIIRYNPASSDDFNPIRDVVNYPNPANPSTTIRFRSVVSGRYSVHIYNTLGALVRTIRDNASIAAGETVAALWDLKNDHGRRVSSGVYIYRIAMDDKSETRKILIIK